MSDLYVVLRSRLENVANWIALGTEAMEDAQARLGLSDERLARKIPVSTRTWIRWKKRGEVPVQWLSNVAAVLELQIERSQPVRVSVDESSFAAAPPAELAERAEGLLARLEAAVSRLEKAAG